MTNLQLNKILWIAAFCSLIFIDYNKFGCVSHRRIYLQEKVPELIA